MCVKREKMTKSNHKSRKEVGHLENIKKKVSWKWSSGRNARLQKKNEEENGERKKRRKTRKEQSPRRGTFEATKV